MFTIEKDLNGIFWHIYNNAKTKVNVSDFDIVIDAVALTFIIQCKNGSNIPSQAISINLIEVVDLSVGTSPIAFSGANGLIQLLSSLNYTPYLQPTSGTVTVYKVGQVGVFTMTPTQFTNNFDGTGLGINTMIGWALRNGNNGTKDQQGKFSLNKGASPYDVIGTLGGSANSVLPAHDHESAVFSNGRKGVNEVGTGGTFNGNILVEAEANEKIVKTSVKGQSNTGADAPSETGVGKNMPPYLIDVWVERVTDLEINAGGGGGIQSIVAGTNISVDNTDPLNPIVSATGSAGVPTFQQVTDEGNTTTNDVIVKQSATIKTTVLADVDEASLVAEFDGNLAYIGAGATQSIISTSDTNGTSELSSTALQIASDDYEMLLQQAKLVLTSLVDQPSIGMSGVDGSVSINTDLLDAAYTQQLPPKDGTFAMLDDVTGVPYTGASQDVNLGEFGLLTGNIEFDTTPTNIPTAAGSMVWNDTDGTLDLKLKGGNVTLQVGQENVLRVVNKTATNINLLEANYQAVRVTGAQGQRLKVDLAQATTDTLSAETIGLVTETINNNQEGFITTSGLIRNVNTTGSLQSETWADGDILYLSPTTAGNLTKVKPVAPNHLVIIGYVVSAHATQGSIFVKVDNGYELDELHNVKIASAANNQLLAYTSSTDIWENKNLNDIIVDTNRTIGIAFFDDFLGTNDNAGINTSTGVVMSGTGAGSVTRITGVYPNRTNQQGVVQIATGTTTSGTASFRLGSLNTPTFFIGSGTVSYEVYINIETLSTLANRFVNVFGLYTGSSTQSSNNAITFIYDEGGVWAFGAIGASPNWRCVTVNGGTRTTTTTAVAITASAWTKLRIEINAGGTSVEFFINDVSVGTHTTNIPAATTAMHFFNSILKTTGTTSINMYADYLSLKQNFTTAR